MIQKYYSQEKLPEEHKLPITLIKEVDENGNHIRKSNDPNMKVENPHLYDPSLVDYSN